jgi:hypothetical protein
LGATAFFAEFGSDILQRSGQLFLARLYEPAVRRGVHHGRDPVQPLLDDGGGAVLRGDLREEDESLIKGVLIAGEPPALL